MPTFPRLPSIDLMRGLVIALMALDHTRDFFSNALFNPTNLQLTTAALFITRWITHLCAPTFVFLAGVSAYLYATRHQLRPTQLAAYLISRGLWLVLLELTVVHFGWTFNWDLHQSIGQVIWALGWSMVLLAGLIFLARPVIGVIAVTMIFGHNLFDGVQPDAFGAWGWLWQLLHVRSNISFWQNYEFGVIYPLIPWVGVMAAGYCFSPVFLLAEQQRKRWLLAGGTACLLLFLLLRIPNLYGDPHPWLVQKSPLFSFFSLINCTKYPPSLLYLLITLGIMLLLLRLLENKRLQSFAQPLLVLGRVPIFFYLLHLLLIHGAILLISWLRGFPTSWLFQSPWATMPFAQFGYDLPIVYAAWFSVLMLLYPLSRAYGALKKRHPQSWWVGYL